MNSQPEFIRALSIFLSAHTDQSAAFLEKLISEFLRGGQAIQGVNPELKKQLIKRLQSDMRGVDVVPSFLQNFLLSFLAKDVWPAHVDFIASRYLKRSSGQRFQTWQDRQQWTGELANEIVPGTELGLRQMLYSQGAGSVFTWRGVRCFKTVNDMAIYMMLLHELQPRTIIELGSGSGGSALLLADICTAMKLQPDIISVDTSPAEITDARITFVQSDCVSWLAEAKTSKREFGRPCLIIEDFHGDLADFFGSIDSILRKDDYLFIEDSIVKQARIAELILNRHYMVDTKYTDFFGINCMSAINSIFVKTAEGSPSPAQRDQQLLRDQDRAWRQRNNR